jgi:hypothetical protein
LKRRDDDWDVCEFRKLGSAAGSEECPRAAAAASADNDHRSRFIARDRRQSFRDVTDLAARLCAGVGDFVVQNCGRYTLRRLRDGRQAVEHMHRYESRAELSGERGSDTHRGTSAG